MPTPALRDRLCAAGRIAPPLFAMILGAFTTLVHPALRLRRIVAIGIIAPMLLHAGSGDARAPAITSPVPTAPGAPPPVMAPDDAFIAAHDAAVAGDAALLATLAPTLSGHPLAVYVEYWELLVRIKSNQAQAAEIDDFLARHDGSVLADRLRADWMLALGAQGDLPAFDALGRSQVWWRDDPQIRCYAMLDRYNRTPRRPEVAGEARELLAQSHEGAGEGCTALATALIGGGDLAPWQRIRTLVEQNLAAGARRTALASLPDGDNAVVAQVIEHPDRWLARHDSDLGRAPRQPALVAISRLAREQPDVAERYATRLAPALTVRERGAIWCRIGHMAAVKLMPEALDWYRRGCDQVGNGAEIPRIDEALEWQVRAGLRAQPGPDWLMIRNAIQRMSPDQRKQPAWVYWQAHALAAGGNDAGARDLLATIAGQYQFYGRLAAEELGIAPALPQAPVAAAADDVAAYAANPGLMRAQKLLDLGLQNEGIREWNWQMRGLGDRQLLAAAEFARSRGLFDRMISTSERTQVEIDVAQRFPMPLHDELDGYASALGLDAPWLYGLIRQESRFSPVARSVTGAQGLMQLMPATARFVARRLSIADYAPERIAEPAVNLRLGTAYLKMVLDDLDGMTLLATAAYNAGPGRVHQWRATLDRPLDGLIFIETIPLAETREYVKRVMANSVVYAMLAGDPAPSLKARLATVAPKAAATTTELP
jgi:peptidoglycan lytic transglycosylase